MRLTPKQVETIKAAVRRHFGPHACVLLFGSRLDDHQRGGDFDFYVETTLTDADRLFDHKLGLLAELRSAPAFADEKIDLVVRGNLPGPQPPIHDFARRTGVAL